MDECVAFPCASQGSHLLGGVGARDRLADTVMSYTERILLVAVAVLLACSVAQAECVDSICFAMENGNGNCSQANPCSIDTALAMVQNGETVAVMGQITVSVTLVLSTPSMRLEGFFGDIEDASLSCAVADGPCVLVEADDVTIQGLVFNGVCQGTCLSLRSTSQLTTHTLQLVAFQEISVASRDDAASLVRLAGNEELLLHRCLVQECTLSGSTAGILVKAEAAAAAAVRVESIFVYGKMDSSEDAPLLSCMPGLSSDGPFSCTRFPPCLSSGSMLSAHIRTSNARK